MCLLSLLLSLWKWKYMIILDFLFLIHFEIIIRRYIISWVFKLIIFIQIYIICIDKIFILIYYRFFLFLIAIIFSLILYINILKSYWIFFSLGLIANLSLISILIECNFLKNVVLRYLFFILLNSVEHH